MPASLTSRARANQVSVDASAFSGNLGPTDTDVQAALDTIDAMSGGGIDFTSVRAVSSDFTIDSLGPDQLLLVSTAAARNLTLPSPTNGRVLYIKDSTGSAETNNITLIQNAAEKINGVAASRILSTNWGTWQITSDGTDWFIL